MLIEQLFSDSKWKILCALADQDLSPKELAIRTKSTLANISSQMQIIEALGFVESHKVKHIKQSGPRKKYTLKKNIAYLTFLSSFSRGKKILPLKKENLAFISIWLLPDEQIISILLRWYGIHFDIIKEAHSFGFIDRVDNTINLLILSQKPELYYDINNLTIFAANTEYIIHLHLHKPQDFKQKFIEGDSYFVSTLQKTQIINEQEPLLIPLKKKL